MGSNKAELLSTAVRHIDIKKTDFVSLIEQMQGMAFQSRNLARAASLYEQMLTDQNCGIILCLAGSLVSAGLKIVLTLMN